ncbi:MAG: UDP-N-acetylmuramoyl-L-alanyl-D-glutamate--2,6-diaminopimelate ligase [Candidatus Sungbacteria bacterium]|nr:UDP-N-acetylmuramoyl-L-alanyl-D-glutamate--2,6-diaminopimelate ligase [Candidatus Sungbacteria bacterium]
MLDRIFYFFREYVIPKPIFRFFQPAYHWLLATAGAIIYGFPARGLIVIGVTGTNGKSTVVEMLHRIFEADGKKVASLSSIRFKIGDKEVENKFKMTMPGRFFVQKFLSDAKKSGVTHVILEVTSEGIKQFRHKYIPFAAAVLTNLTPEHLEAHGGFENYKRAKGKLFKGLGGQGVAVVNLGDQNADYFLSFKAKQKIGYMLNYRVGAGSKLSKVLWPSKYEVGDNGIHLYFSEGWEVASPLKGLFNAENMLAAIAVAEAFGISHESIRKAFADFRGVPGRMEEIKAKDFSVVVDYAFTPNALRQVYKTLSGGAKKLICVLGATGGGRDKWKRPELGKIAGEYCFKVIITDEDPYNEDPRSIMEDVRRGVEASGGRSKIIEDRRLAIREALSSARAGDVVIITGKGSESAIAVAGGKKIPWDDRNVVIEELKTLFDEKIGL